MKNFNFKNVLGLLILPLLILFSMSGHAFATDYNSFASDEAIDRWLMANSKTYEGFAQSIRQRPGMHGYRFVRKGDIAMGMLAAMSDGCLEVQLHPGLKGALLVNTISFEMANGYLNDIHQQIDKLLHMGQIKSKEEFALAHEIYEYEALRLHRQVLIELAASIKEPLPPDFYYFVSPKPQTIADYQIPQLSHYIEAQKASGHTAHYYKEYDRQLKMQDKKPAMREAEPQHRRRKGC